METASPLTPAGQLPSHGQARMGPKAGRECPKLEDAVDGAGGPRASPRLLQEPSASQLRATTFDKPITKLSFLPWNTKNIFI